MNTIIQKPCHWCQAPVSSNHLGDFHITQCHNCLNGTILCSKCTDLASSEYSTKLKIPHPCCPEYQKSTDMLTPEQLEQTAAAMLAHKEGKPIEYRRKGEPWSICDYPLWDFKNFEYRPKPKLDTYHVGLFRKSNGQTYLSIFLTQQLWNYKASPSFERILQTIECPTE